PDTPDFLVLSLDWGCDSNGAENNAKAVRESAKKSGMLTAASYPDRATSGPTGDFDAPPLPAPGNFFPVQADIAGAPAVA
ncbi:MAG: hypothetical protein M3021_07285, partial [Actinomycetota bacterium]|nr:hypothetical protein [Actinomycetota bacterium]